MPILATGNKYSRPSREAGFSLVELLAVLAILSLMVGAVVMNLPESDQAFDVEAQSLHAKVGAFLDDGAQAGEIRALGVATEGLALYRHDGLEWREVSRHAWPEEARISLIIEDSRESLPEEASPDYLFEPYGVVSDLNVQMDGRESSYNLISQVDTGELILQADR